jgi:hypothetical protein
MNRSRLPLIFGGLLVLAGIVYLLQNFGVLQFKLSSWMWAGLFAIGSGLLAGYWFRNRDEWWAIIPAGALLGFTVTSIFDALSLFQESDLDGAIFLICLALSFLLVYATRPTALWWAIIPGGVLLTLAVIVIVHSSVDDRVSAGLLFLGIGLSFVGVALQPSKPANRWAWIPAGVLVVMGIVSFVGVLNLFAWLLPVGLIVFGGVLLWRALRNSKQ